MTVLRNHSGSGLVSVSDGVARVTWRLPSVFGSRQYFFRNNFEVIVLVFGIAPCSKVSVF